MSNPTSGSSFQETRWTQVERAQGTGEAAALALSDLCGAYHRPVQAFIRHWCGDGEQAKDLTQDFFASLLARPALAAERRKGRFRSYLLGTVKHFLLEQKRKAGTLRHGGGLPVESLDETANSRADTGGLPPDKLFDQQWACSVLERALEHLSDEMDSHGKTELFSLLRPWLAETAAHGDQQAIAARLGLSETAIRVQVHRLRKRYREWIETEVGQTLNGSVSLQEEMQHLLAALAGR